MGPNKKAAAEGLRAELQRALLGGGGQKLTSQSRLWSTSPLGYTLKSLHFRTSLERNAPHWLLWLFWEGKLGIWMGER